MSLVASHALFAKSPTLSLASAALSAAALAASAAKSFALFHRSLMAAPPIRLCIAAGSAKSPRNEYTRLLWQNNKEYRIHVLSRVDAPAPPERRALSHSTGEPIHS